MKVTGLIKYDSMCRAIAEAAEVDEVKDMRDQAMAIERYAAQALNMDAEIKAREIRLRAERKLGKLLKKQKENGERATPQATLKRGPVVAPNDHGKKTLSDVGLSKTQSSRFQQLAEIPEEEFEAALSDPDETPSTTGLIRKLSGDGGKVHPEANWVNSWLRDFEDGKFKLPPSKIVRELTPTMAARIKRTAPGLAAWFTELHKEVENAGFTDN